MKRFLLPIAVAALAAVAIPQTTGQAKSEPAKPDPAAILKSIEKYRADAVAQAYKDKRRLDYEALDKELADQAKKAIAGIDVKAIEKKDAYDWAQLFDLAGEREQAINLADKGAVYEGGKAADVQLVALDNLLHLGKTDQILSKIAFASAPNYQSLSDFGDWLQYELTPKVIDSNPQLVLDAYDILLSRLSPKVKVAGDDTKRLALATTDLVVGRSKVLFYTGHRREALAAIDKLKRDYAKDELASLKANQAFNQLSLIDKAAPEIKFDRQIGSFAGLKDLKGKVVVLDFFAHWCGPCKRAFPELRKLYSELKDKGLAIVGVTGYYGYYGPEKGIKPEVEFDRVKEFVPMQGLEWPVVFTDVNQRTAFGVGPIPHTVVIDRKGIIRYVEVGVGSAPEGQLRHQIEKYLAQ